MVVNNLAARYSVQCGITRPPECFTPVFSVLLNLVLSMTFPVTDWDGHNKKKGMEYCNQYDRDGICLDTSHYPSHSSGSLQTGIKQYLGRTRASRDILHFPLVVAHICLLYL